MAIIRCLNHDRFGSCVGEVEAYVERDDFGSVLVIRTERDEIRISPAPDLHRLAAHILAAAERLDRVRSARRIPPECCMTE